MHIPSEAAEQAVDGTPEELRYFLEVGQYEVNGQVTVQTG